MSLHTRSNDGLFVFLNRYASSYQWATESLQPTVVWQLYRTRSCYDREKAAAPPSSAAIQQ